MFSQSAYIVCVLNFTVFMAIGSLRFATSLIEKYYLISSQNTYKVISSYSFFFFNQEPYRRQLNSNHTNGLNVLVSICYFTA